jgi:hypothetical protein
VQASGKQTSVRVGNISDISGNVNVAGGNITTHHTVIGLSTAEIKQLFERLYTEIDARAKTSLADKEDIKAEVKEIQATLTEAAQKNEKVDEDSCASLPQYCGGARCVDVARQHWGIRWQGWVSQSRRSRRRRKRRPSRDSIV